MFMNDMMLAWHEIHDMIIRHHLYMTSDIIVPNIGWGNRYLGRDIGDGLQLIQSAKIGY